MDPAAAAVERAQELLRTYTLALRQDGAEAYELLDSGVPHHTVAALYPYETDAWQSGYERLILTGPVPRKLLGFDGKASEARMVRPHRRPAGLTKESWASIQWLGKRIPLTSPYLSGTHWERYRTLSRRIAIGGPDSFTHAEMLVILLHVLASSPEAESALRGSPETLSYATTVLDAAQGLSTDSHFEA